MKQDDKKILWRCSTHSSEIKKVPMYRPPKDMLHALRVSNDGQVSALPALAASCSSS